MDFEQDTADITSQLKNLKAQLTAKNTDDIFLAVRGLDDSKAWDEEMVGLIADNDIWSVSNFYRWRREDMKVAKRNHDKSTLDYYRHQFAQVKNSGLEFVRPETNPTPAKNMETCLKGMIDEVLEDLNKAD